MSEISPVNPAQNPDLENMEAKVQEAMRTVYDPEIPVNIYDLGLVYGMTVEPSGQVNIRMTLTAPSCPEAMSLPARVETVVRGVPGVSDVKLELVWDPPWTFSMMSEAARLRLGL